MKMSVYRHRVILVLLLLFSFNTQVFSRDIAGINIEEQITVKAIDEVLKLNGAGIRSKFFFKIYVGALYLPKKETNASTILRNASANRIAMHFLHSEVTREKLVSAWVEGFKDNLDNTAYTAITARLDKFNQMFSDLHKGDVVLLDYIPQKGTRVTIKNEVKGTIEGADFNRALLSVWLGEEPVTENLKKAMLGE